MDIPIIESIWLDKNVYAYEFIWLGQMFKSYPYGKPHSVKLLRN